jgi:hypothetical protein
MVNGHAAAPLHGDTDVRPCHTSVDVDAFFPDPRYYRPFLPPRRAVRRCACGMLYGWQAMHGWVDVGAPCRCWPILHLMKQPTSTTYDPYL